jgi:Flp pilus assembly protein TadG
MALFLAIGAAVDYSRATSLRARLQSATDAATLAAAKRIATLDDKALTDLAQQIIASQTSDPTAKVTKLNVSNDKSRIEIASTAISTNAFMQIAGFKEIPLSADAATAIDNSTYEIALVLDNSGSMAASAGGSSKIQALRDAANQLVDTMLTSGPSASRTKISIVPFTLSVQVGAQYATASWMDRTAQSPIHWQNFNYASSSWKPASRFDIFSQLNIPWGGCVESRPGDWGVTDAAPTSSDPSSLFVPMLAPDEPGDAGATSYSTSTATWTYENSYVGDNPTLECASETNTADEYQAAQGKLCKYRNAPFANTASGRGRNFMCDAKPLLRLTTDMTALHGSINAMTAGGNTNLFEGFAWGWRTLSPNAPFSDGKAYNRSYGVAARRSTIVAGKYRWSAPCHSGMI